MSSFWDRLKTMFTAPVESTDSGVEKAVRQAMLERVARKESFTALDIANQVTEHDPNRTVDDLRDASLLVTKLFVDGLLKPFDYVHDGTRYSARVGSAATAAATAPVGASPGASTDDADIEQAVRKAIHARVSIKGDIEAAVIARVVFTTYLGGQPDTARFARAKDFAAKFAATLLPGVGYVESNGTWTYLTPTNLPRAGASSSRTTDPTTAPAGGGRADAYLTNPEIMGLSASEMRERALKIDPYRTAWIGRVDTIPPQSDPRTALIDRGLILRGLLTEKQIAEIHTVGDLWLRHHDAVKLANALAARSVTALVERMRAEKAALKAQKKAQAEAKAKLRTEAVAHRKANDIIYLGRGVSHGLNDRRSNLEALQQYGLPVLSTPADVARVMGLTVPTLRWLCFHAEAAAKTHYRYTSIAKRSGGQRIIAAPAKKLKAAQHWVLHEVLERLPVDAAAHGFVKGHSVVSNAKPHVGQGVVINLDLKDFFPTVNVRRVRGLFQSFGYSPAVATVFALLCTEAPRREVEYAGRTLWVAVGERCLPQGAPTSPAISNLITRKLDRRLKGRLGKRGWVYTRYADDLSFSKAEFSRGEVGFLHATIRHVVDEEGFALNAKKGRVQGRSTRQEVTGVVVNVKPSLAREELRRLRAILHQAAKTGLEAQNREGVPEFRRHLEGKIAYLAMIDPVKAAKLKAALSLVK